MLKPTKTQRVSVTALIVTTIGILLGSVDATLAQEPQRVSAAPTFHVTSAQLHILEDAFWVCDYVATTRGHSDISTCTAVYEALKDRKFAGNFDALVFWWRQNKATQHKNIAVAEAAK